MMVEYKQRNTTLKKLARWTPSAETNKHSYPPLSQDAPFVHVHHDQLQQGLLYILKIKQVSLALFEGWNDDMCCFSVLRAEVDPLRWSSARQLPGDFDAFEAFDEAGNPPIHLWPRYLKVSVPSNWFCMFEEAKRKQREWIQDHIPDEHTATGGAATCSNTDVSTMDLNSSSLEEVQPMSIVHVEPSTRSFASPVPSQQSMIMQEKSLHILDREQIKRHLAPGQAMTDTIDQFSIPSDVYPSSSKSKNRASMKKMIFG